MVSLYGRMMNLVFRCMPRDKPGQLHDYAAERRRNDRKPPRPPKGVTVEHITLAGLPAERIGKAGNDKGTVFLSASDAEALLDDARMLYDKLRAAGHPAGLDIRHGVCHAFQVFPAMPEAREAREQTFAFLEEIE